MVNDVIKALISASAVLVVLPFGTEALGNVVGVDAQNFNVTTNGLDFVTVQSSETLDPCVLNLGLFVNHGKNTLPIFKNAAGGSSHKDYVTGADLNLGYGLMKNWDLGISLPQILAQKVESDSYRGEFGAKGNTEVRLNSKIRLFGGRRGGGAVIGTVSMNRLENNPFAGKDPGPTATLEMALDTTIRMLAIGANLGYRWRNPGEPLPDFPVVPFKNQYIYSAAASYHFSRLNTKIIAEIFGSAPQKKVQSELAASQSSLEGLLGLKYDVTQNVALHAGAGTRLKDGVASPDLRVYGGVNVALGPFCSEHSKIPVKKPQVKSPPPPKTETIVLENVMFAFDSPREVLPGTRLELKKLVDYLLTAPQFVSLSIEGHTDSMGTDEYNQTLSENRAATIRRFLVEVHKLDPLKITSIGYGESRPIADNGNYQGRQLNRRVEFKISR